MLSAPLSWPWRLALTQLNSVCPTNPSVLVGDITYVPTDEGWLFMAVVIDLFSRHVVGWSMREDMTRDIVIDALRIVWFKRHPCLGITEHSLG